MAARTPEWWQTCLVVGGTLGCGTLACITVAAAGVFERIPRQIDINLPNLNPNPTVRPVDGIFPEAGPRIVDSRKQFIDRFTAPCQSGERQCVTLTVNDINDSEAGCIGFWHKDGRYSNVNLSAAGTGRSIERGFLHTKALRDRVGFTQAEANLLGEPDAVGSGVPSNGWYRAEAVTICEPDAKLDAANQWRQNNPR